MKTINVTFEDGEFELLEVAKGGDNWREFILTLVRSKKRRTKMKCKNCGEFIYQDEQKTREGSVLRYMHITLSGVSKRSGKCTSPEPEIIKS